VAVVAVSSYSVSHPLFSDASPPPAHLHFHHVTRISCAERAQNLLMSAINKTPVARKPQVDGEMCPCLFSDLFTYGPYCGQGVPAYYAISPPCSHILAPEEATGAR
jgi:hypothetical protein